MRGADRQTAAMFSYVSPEGLVPQARPLRAIRTLVNAALQRLSSRLDKIYARSGRDSIVPERLLRALLLQALFSVRSERQLMEQTTYNMMFRWFDVPAPVWEMTVSIENRERLLQGDIARGFLAAILVDPRSSRCCRTSTSWWMTHRRHRHAEKGHALGLGCPAGLRPGNLPAACPSVWRRATWREGSNATLASRFSAVRVRPAIATTTAPRQGRRSDA